MVAERLRNLSDAMEEIRRGSGMEGITLNDIRFICQYERIPAYTDGRTRTRYIDETGFRHVSDAAHRLIVGRFDYGRTKVHPSFLETKTC